MVKNFVASDASWHMALRKQQFLDTTHLSPCLRAHSCVIYWLQAVVILFLQSAAMLVALI
jgi:hypothetical protein